VKDFLFTSESVSEGHPDKVADQISDAILDALIEKDPRCHVACETMVTTGLVLVAGEISTKAYVDVPRVVRDTIRDIGYDNPHHGFDWETVAVLTSIDEQSPDIAMGVERQDPLSQGAGDQGIMFGYATDETPEYMPLPLVLANRISRRLDDVRKDGTLGYLGPDGKCQVTIEYDGRRALRVHTVVCSAQHSDQASIEQVRADLEKHVVMPCLPADLMTEKPILHLNRTGRFVKGGPAADTGLTGRKIIADSYGGLARHGGGAFSGKDPSKVDRSAAYAARWVAKNVVAAGLAGACEIQLAYCIGHAEPVSIHLETFGTAKVAEENVVEAIRRNFDLRPGAIIRDLDLLRPIYRSTAAFGHFGRDEFSWEKLDRVDALRKLL